MKKHTKLLKYVIKYSGANVGRKVNVPVASYIDKLIREKISLYKTGKVSKNIKIELL